MNLRIASCSLSLAVSAAFAGMMPLHAAAAPSVNFKAPKSGSTISGNIYQSKACEVQGSNIDRVRFYLDSTTLNTEENAPWNCNVDTTKFADGAHTLRAVAYDRSGASRSTQISVNIKNSTTSTNTPPTVSFKAPLNGATVSGSLSGSTCEAAASDGDGIKQVQFFMDGTALNTELSAPYNCTLDTSKFADGAHVLKAVATDGAGASSSAQVSLTVQNGTASGSAPTIAWKMPAEGGALSGNVQGPPNCVVDGTNIAKVMFYINGTWTNTDGNLDNGLGCWIDTTKYPDGAYTVKAVAYDSAGQTASAERSIVIQNTASTNTPPSVSFKAPLNGATVSGSLSGSTCEALASDSNGIKQVQFYMDGTALNTELSSPYNCALDTRNFPDGAHTLKAVATDGLGASSTSQIGITVRNSTTTTTLPAPGTGTLEIWFKSPIKGATLSGLLQLDKCYVAGRGVSKVSFFLDSTALNTDTVMSDGMSCVLDTTKFANGTHTLKAVAYDSAGNTYVEPISVNIQNTASTPTNVAPTVSITSPAEGAKVSGSSVAFAASASDSDGSVAKVEFLLGGTLLATDTTNAYSTTVDTTKYANGTYTLIARATDNAGAVTSAQRTVTIENAASTPSVTIDAADIIGQALPDLAFSQHTGYNGQVLGQYPEANSIPETGITGSVLPNGETLRLGKETDPVDSARKALVFQLHPSDPITSGSKRAEITYGKNIEMENTYWVAFKVFVRDWGALSSGDAGLFGTQLHSGDNSAGYSPSFGIYTSGSDARNFKIQVRGTGLSGTLNYAEQPLPFSRWIDFVFKVRQSAGSTGFLQTWMDGNQIVNHSGPIGYKTAYNDYFKFGYYNWSSAFDSTRKVLMRSVTIVQDPTGSKYDAAKLRAFINQ